MKKYADIAVYFTVSFEDDEDMDLHTQAIEQAADMLDCEASIEVVGPIRDTENPAAPDTCTTCEGTGKEGRHSICRDCAETPTPQTNVVPCPCTLIEQGEDCPIGYPSMICGVCKGTGNTTPDQVTALACEMIKIASDIGEPEDPFAAWESVSLVQSQRNSLLEEARDAIASASDTYKKRNGHLATFEDDSGEKCWIVPFDAFEGLRSTVNALAAESAE